MLHEPRSGFTPLVHQWHNEHKARQARYAAAAVEIKAAKVRLHLEHVKVAETTREAQKEQARNRAAVWYLLRGFSMGITEDIVVVHKIQDIQRAVCKHLDIRMIDLLSARRTDVVVVPRQIAMYLCREMTLKSLPEIGRRFGGRDHSTVWHAVDKITALIAKDPVFRAKVEALREEIAPTQGGM